MYTVNGFPSNYFPHWKILVPPESEKNIKEAQSKISSPSVAPTGTSNILAGALHYNQEKVPTMEVTSAVSALRVLDEMSYLAALSQRLQTPFTQQLNKKMISGGEQTDTLIGIRESLKTLSASVTSLLGPDALNLKTAKSSDPSLVEAKAGNAAPISSLTVVPRQASSGNILVSDEQASTHPALGLTGSFTINGYRVPVVSTDTIHTLKDKINYGEDLNHNGTLDGAEDIDGTGQPGVIFVRAGEYTKGIYIVKDKNGKGYLYPTEDANDNGQLDGGTENIKVVATIQDNRMYLTGIAEGAHSIDLQDPDNILLALGFFTRDYRGRSIQAEKQITTVNTVLPPPGDLMVSASKAAIQANGKSFNNNTNEFKGVVEDTTLTVKKASDVQVKIDISQDPSNAIDKLKIFFDNFNSAIREINNALIASGTFDADTDIQRLRNRLTQPQDEVSAVSKQNEGMIPYLAQHENQQMTGLGVNEKKGVMQEIAVNSQVQSIKDQLAGPFKSLPLILQKRLSSIGIQSVEDSTFSVDEAALKRALTINSDAVLNLFTDVQTGILPRLNSQLNSALEKDFGRVDFKAKKIEGEANLPLVLAEKYQKYIAAFSLQERVHNLISVA